MLGEVKGRSRGAQGEIKVKGSSRGDQSQGEVKGSSKSRGAQGDELSLQKVTNYYLL